MSAATVYRTCPHCGFQFGQPNDPGRKRRYCSDACKQAAYRTRQRQSTGATNGQRRTGRHRRQQQQEEEHARREREQARAREEDARRRQRQRTYQPPPSSSNGHSTSSAEHERIRRIIEGLLRKAASTNFPHEAAACREKAEHLRRKYGL